MLWSSYIFSTYLTERNLRLRCAKQLQCLIFKKSQRLPIYISLHEIVVSKFFFLHAFNGSDENPFVNEKFKNKHICFVLNSVFGWPGTHVKQSDGFDKCRFKKNSVPAHCMDLKDTALLKITRRGREGGVLRFWGCLRQLIFTCILCNNYMYIFI